MAGKLASRHAGKGLGNVALLKTLVELFVGIAGSIAEETLKSTYKPGRPYRHRPHEDEGTSPPTSPGEYRIRDEEGKVVYVGETNDLRRRQREHIRTGKLKPGETFDYKVADGRSTSTTRREHEREKIKTHQPERNKSGGGEGRKAKK